MFSFQTPTFSEITAMFTSLNLTQKESGWDLFAKVLPNQLHSFNGEVNSCIKKCFLEIYDIKLQKKIQYQKSVFRTLYWT